VEDDVNVRRFPRDVAEERLEKIIAMAMKSGQNVVWLSQDAFTVRSLEPHKRYRARLKDGVYTIDELL
jgi:mRNA degradation ribonuclease J1/J2